MILLLNMKNDSITKYENDVKIAGPKNLTPHVMLKTGYRIHFSSRYYPERATSLFSYNGVFTSRAIFRYDFPAKITVSGYVRIEI